MDLEVGRLIYLAMPEKTSSKKTRDKKAKGVFSKFFIQCIFTIAKSNPIYEAYKGYICNSNIIFFKAAYGMFNEH